MQVEIAASNLLRDAQQFMVFSFFHIFTQTLKHKTNSNFAHIICIPSRPVCLRDGLPDPGLILSQRLICDWKIKYNTPFQVLE